MTMAKRFCNSSPSPLLTADVPHLLTLRPTNLPRLHAENPHLNFDLTSHAGSRGGLSKPRRLREIGVAAVASARYLLRPFSACRRCFAHIARQPVETLDPRAANGQRIQVLAQPRRRRHPRRRQSRFLRLGARHLLAIEAIRPDIPDFVVLSDHLVRLTNVLVLSSKELNL